MHIKTGWILMGWILVGSGGGCFAADLDVRLATTDGSTRFAIQNSAAAEVASIDSLGRITVGSVRGRIVPSGTLIITTSTCPSGFTEYAAAGGYYLVGVPSGGTVTGTVGSAMTDLSNATHSHSLTAGTANNTSTLGGQPRVTDITTPTGTVARGTIAPFFQVRLCSVP